MMGEPPVLDEARDALETERSNTMVLSFQDRSVTEIETSFSEHFVLEPGDTEGDETPVMSGDFSSSEFNTLPSLHQHHTNTTLEPFNESDPVVDDGAIIVRSPVPYQETNKLLVNNTSNPRAMKYNRSENPDEDDTESKSTTFGAVEKIDFNKTFCPVYYKKSFESDSVIGLTTESGTESLNCDSAIESEANNVADNIFQDNIVNEADKDNSETFLVSATSDQVVSLKDFAFENQENFFHLPDDFKIPLNIPKNQLLDIPMKQSFLGQSSKTFEDLSLIEEITEHSSLSTIKSREVTPRIPSEAPNQSDDTNQVHKPRILKKTLSLDSPRGVSNNKITKICSEIDFKLPSKSNPATPREDQNDADKSKKQKFAQNKPKIVAKRYQRSPPRDSPSVPKPIQTKTGLVVTQVTREEEPVMGRSSSSASLILRSSPQPLDRQVSKSTENIPTGQIPRYKRQKYDHVESKVKKYIEESQRNNSQLSKMQRKRELSNSSSSLVKMSSNDLPVPVLEVRPKTADATTLKLSRPSGGGGLQKIKMKRLLSKSETNLKHCKVLSTPSALSKSSFSIGHIGAIYDTSEEEDVTQLTAIYNDEKLDTKAGSLLDLVAKERKSKQEAKKVITELQTSFDDLLQRYAAAENALDKVRFGIKPSDDGSRQEAFTMAEKIAEKIASFEIKEKQERSVGAFEVKKTDKKMQIAREKLVGISNQVSGLSMSVQCGVVSGQEAMEAVMEVKANLEDITRTFGCEDNAELAALYYEARKSLDELKKQLRKSGQAEDQVDPAQSFLASIKKVSAWQVSLPAQPGDNNAVSSCYGSGSLPTSPTSPVPGIGRQFDSITIPSKTTENDSGCPGSDRSTLWLSYLQSKRASPSTRSNSKSKENISNSLYNLEEESVSPSPRKKSLHQGVGQVTPRDIVDINKDFVASITIESSDNPREIQHLATSTPNGPRLSAGSCTDNCSEQSRKNVASDVPPTPSKSAKKLNLCKNLFPGVENTELAQQIDNEILELRNFFDDHREEMLYLLHGSKDDPMLMNHSLPADQCGPWKDGFHQKQSQSLLNIRQPDHDRAENQVLSSGCTTPDLPDPANFNLHDSVISKFENNPRQEMFRSLQDWNTWKEESESDNVHQDLTLKIRKLEFEKRRKKKERQRRRQAIEDFRDFSPPVKQNIQSFFPNFQEFEEKPVMVQSSRDRYHEEQDGDMDLNNEIPLLHLSDLTSEITAPDMSIISEAFSASQAHSSQLPPRENLREYQPLDGRTSRSIACDTLDLVTIPKCPTSTQTTPGREAESRDTKAFNTNTSLPLLQGSTYNLSSNENILEAPQNSHNVIIIKQTGCDHAVDVRKKRAKDKKKKKTTELKDLLSSLDSAASLAERLRKRSENLLQSINNDFTIDS